MNKAHKVACLRNTFFSCLFRLYNRLGGRLYATMIASLFYHPKVILLSLIVVQLWLDYSPVLRTLALLRLSPFSVEAVRTTKTPRDHYIWRQKYVCMFTVLCLKRTLLILRSLIKRCKIHVFIMLSTFQVRTP